VWHHIANPIPLSDVPFPGPIAMFEDDHDLADALVVGSLLIVLLRHADRVRIACLAQLVNAIAPIRTQDGGAAWRQATYYPVRDVFQHGLGEALRVLPVGSPDRVSEGGAVDAVDLAAVHDPTTGDLSVFVVDRIGGPVPLTISLHGFGALHLVEHVQLTGDLAATNTADDPDRVTPVSGAGAHITDETLSVSVPGHSWTMLRLGRAG